MPLRTDSLEEPQINLTPMVDVVFLLIIFFMVGAKFSEIEQKFDVDLPTAAPMETMSRQPDPIVVTVSRTGEVAFNGDEVTAAELREKLMAAKSAWADQPVLIRGDGEGRFQAVIDVMDLCRELQIKRFSLAFQPVEREGAP